MIVKNESSTLERCLNSVKNHVDEIIIVDTGSTDDTRDIAKKYTDKLYDFKWIDDFSKARNFALSKATKEWILILDADEVIAEKDILEINEIIKSNNFDALKLIQRNYSNIPTKIRWQPLIEKIPESKGYIGYGENPIIRVIKNNLGIKYTGAVHEVLDYSIKENDLRILTTKIPIHHYIEEKPIKKRQLEYLRIAEKAAAEKPSGRYYIIIATVNMHITKDFKKAVEYFGKCIELGYKINECYECMAQCYLEQKNYKSAYESYRILIKKRHITFTVCNNIGQILLRYKKYPQAIKFLNMAIKLGIPNKEKIYKQIDTINSLIAKNR